MNVPTAAGLSIVEPDGSDPGDGVDRRTLLQRALRLGAAGVLGGALPGVLAACGKTTPAPQKRSDYFFGYGTGVGGTPPAPPFGDLVRLMAARAGELNVSPTISVHTGANLASLRTSAGRSSTRDPVTGTYPPNYSVVVIGFPESTALERIAADAVGLGVKVVSYLQEIERRTAAISVDAARMGTMLATHAAKWAEQRLGGRGSVLIVEPGRGDIGALASSPFASAAPKGIEALQTTLTRLAPRLAVTRTHGDVTRAVVAHPDVQMVLCWSDIVALGVAQTLRARHPAGTGKLYVGALGVPSLSSRATIDELRRDDVLRAVVAVPLRDLARAAVDLPTTLLIGQPARDIAVAPQLLTPGSAALTAQSRDFSRDHAVPVGLNQNGVGPYLKLNPPKDPEHRPAMRSPSSVPATAG